MSLTRRENQSDAEFLLFVEAQRRVVLPQEPKTSLPYIFVPHVSDAYFYKLEAARANKIINCTGGSVMLTWDDIIAIA
jgi:hypothetical protein